MYWETKTKESKLWDAFLYTLSEDAVLNTSYGNKHCPCVTRYTKS